MTTSQIRQKTREVPFSQVGKSFHNVKLGEVDEKWLNSRIAFAVQANGKVMFVVQDDKGAFHKLKYTTPIVRVVHGSIDGLGGYAIDKSTGTPYPNRSRSLVISEADLMHMSLYDANLKVGKDIKKQTELYAKNMFHLMDMYIWFLVDNPQLYSNAGKDARDKALKSIPKGDRDSKKPEEVDDMAFNFLKTTLNYPVLEDAPDNEKYFKVSGKSTHKFKSKDIFEYNPASGIVPTILPAVLDIYNKGDTMDNPFFKDANEIVQAFNQRRATFDKITISNVNKHIKYGVLGPFIGRNSSVVVAGTFGTSVKGVSSYIEEILVFKGEESSYAQTTMETEYEIPDDLLEESVPLPPAPLPSGSKRTYPDPVEKQDDHNPAGGYAGIDDTDLASGLSAQAREDKAREEAAKPAKKQKK